MSQAIPEIVYETDAKHHVMMYGLHCYSQCSGGQNADFALFKSTKCTNFNIKETPCLYVVHVLQHPTSCPSTLPTQNTMVNAPTRTFCHYRLSNTTTEHSAPHDDINKQMNVIAGWSQTQSELREPGAASDPK